MKKIKNIVGAAKKVADTYGEELTGDAVHEWIGITGAADFGITTADTDAVLHIAGEYLDEVGAVDLEQELKRYLAHN